MTMTAIVPVYSDVGFTDLITTLNICLAASNRTPEYTAASQAVRARTFRTGRYLYSAKNMTVMSTKDRTRPIQYSNCGITSVRKPSLDSTISPREVAIVKYVVTIVLATNRTVETTVI